MLKYNPFRPGSIIHPGMFAGRVDEINAIERAMFQTANGNPGNFLVHGERGIGKSSLLLLLNHYARGTLTSLLGKTYSFLVVSVSLEPTDTYADLVRKVARELQRELDQSEKARRVLNDIWTFITKWEVLGVKYSRDALPPDILVEELGERLIAAVERLVPTFNGIYIMIDEADKPPMEANLGEFVKVLTERLAKRSCGHVGMGIIGISNVIDKMRQSHASSVRIFAPYELKPLLAAERAEVVRRGLDEAEKANGFRTAISDEAMQTLSTISEGYPHFIQQYGYCAFEEDADNTIDLPDLAHALTKENGALHQLGVRYFEGMYSREILSKDYRTVLQAMAQHPNEYMSRKEMAARTGLKHHTINNAVNAMKQRNIILPKEGERGLYRLPSRSFAAWILAFKIERAQVGIGESNAG